MGVGSVKGGGGRGGAKGPKGLGAGPAKTGFVEKAGAAGKAESLVGVSGAAGSGEVGAPATVEKASEIARALRSGEIATKADAARQLVGAILKERMNMQSKALTARIAEQLADDPRLAQTLERIWKKG